MAKQFIFEIPEADPHKIPMTRLLEYLTELATILGNRKHVHFLRVEEGSLPCFMEIEEEVESLVIDRVNEVLNGEGTEEAQAAYKALRDHLKKDNYSALLKSAEGDIVATFPRILEGKILGPFFEDGSIDGILVNIGGTDSTVPVHLLSEGVDFRCNASIDMARKLGHYLLQKPIRVHGRGKWYRNPNGKWSLDLFDISSFEELNDASIPEIVSKLRAIPGNPLMASNDPLEEMRRIRHGE
jgi:hypothetical protein